MEEELKNELNSISKKNAEYFNEISAKLQELETSNKDVKNLTREIGELSESVDKEKKALKNLVESVEENVSSLNQLKSDIDNKITESTNKLGSHIIQQNNGLKSEIVDAISKVDSSVNQKVESIEVFIKTQYSKLTSEKEKLQSDCNNLLQHNGKLEAVVDSLNREIAVEKQNNNDKQSQIVKLNEDISIERANSAKLSGDIGALKAELESYKSQLSAEKEDIQRKNEEISNLSLDIDSKNKEIELKNSENTELMQQLEKTKNDYNILCNHYKSLNIDDTLLVAYEEFLALKDKTKASIETLFPQSSFLGFISAGLRLSNISSLWEMAKRNIFNNNLEDIDKINKIFTLLISIYNEGAKENQFQIISPEIGSKYDSSTSAIKEMKSSGTVKEVHLVGYKNIKDGNIHKAIISVNE